MKVLKQKYKINEIIETSYGSYMIIDYYKKEYIENNKKDQDIYINAVV